MSNKDNNGKEIKLTWVQGPSTSLNQFLNSHDPIKYEQDLLNALDRDLTERCIEKDLLKCEFTEANQVIAQIKQNIKGQK